MARNLRYKGKAVFCPFALGEKVWLEETNLRLAYPSMKLALCRYDSFKVTKIVSPIVYQLELPQS